MLKYCKMLLIDVRSIIMSVFEIVPQTFFSVLASANKSLYVDALLKLAEMLKYGVEIDADDYLSCIISLIETDEYIAEDGDEKDISVMSANRKASIILKRFIDTGWIYKEYKDGSFKQVIGVHNYSVKALNFLQMLSDTDIKEYNSLVFSTYSSLTIAYNTEHEKMYDAVLNAKRNTLKLIEELKALYYNIMDFCNGVRFTESINELLKKQFDLYQQMIDRIYHPIKTMDSFYRYKDPIRQILIDVLSDNKLMEIMSDRAMKISKYKTADEASQRIYSDINLIIGELENIPLIIDKIDVKHNKYSKLSIEKMKYILSGDRTIKGKLNNIMRYYELNENMQDILVDKMQDIININNQGYIDKKSLYHKQVRNRKNLPESLIIAKKSKDSTNMEFEQIVSSFKFLYSDKKINLYLNSLMQGNEEISTKNIIIRNNDEFIMCLLACVKQDEKDIEFAIEFNKGNIISGGYYLPDAVIRRKKCNYDR